MENTALLLLDTSAEELPMTLTESILAEFRGPSSTLKARIDKVISDRLSAHFASLKFGQPLGKFLPVHSLDLLDEAEAFLLRKIRERSV